ncbi:MAG: glutamate 5-kinase [Candidatus Nanopelagicales bacterium]|nr:glutamate 5-kinase [Candidatus Nanopelagicales bacterium]
MSGRTIFGSARRVVVKIGSSSLAMPGDGLSSERVKGIADVVADATLAGRQVVLVTSGAIAAALTPLGLRRPPRDLATQQAAASVGQTALMAVYAASFSQRGLIVGQVLMTSEDVVRRAHYRNAQRTLYRLMELGVVPVVNENDTVATDEIRFGDNDRLAALVAHLVHADAMILLSDVDGLYDGPPHREGSRLVRSVRTADDLNGIELGKPGQSGIGSGGMRTKVEAARIATGAGIPVLVASADDAAAALAGTGVGTYFHVTGRRVPTRLLWLAHAATAVGALHLDSGAVSAVVQRRKSLLPAGIMRVDGRFTAGDPVDILDENGGIVARGLVNFDSAELPRLLGRSTKDLAREFGSSYEREIVHRDSLVVLPRA